MAGNVGLEGLAADLGTKKAFERLEFTVEPEHANLRIDLYLTLKIDGYSRVFLRRVVMQG